MKIFNLLYFICKVHICFLFFKKKTDVKLFILIQNHNLIRQSLDVVEMSIYWRKHIV